MKGTRIERGWVGFSRLLLGLLAAPLLKAAEPAGASRGGEVVVVYNRRAGPDAELLARHYARQRGVPEKQIIELRLPDDETITRADYRQDLEEPLLRELRQRRLLGFETRSVTNGEPKGTRRIRVPVSAAFRYLVLCRGVPLKIASDPDLSELGNAELPAHLRRNGAAVDAELAGLALDPQVRPLTGPFRNPGYGATEPAQLHPTNSLIMVSRLDGPTPLLARALVDQALVAETRGLWGRAFFDARGLTNGSYLQGDEWILGASQVARVLGYETLVDTRPQTLAASYPLPQVALYAGWYDTTVSGPFSRPEVEFQPGAFAYHLYSYSARTLRSSSSWAGAFLARGATATVGYVDEPYLELTLNVPMFLERFLHRGFTFGEAAYAAQNSLSWQTTVIGDPLYRPGGRDLRVQIDALAGTRSSGLDWALLQAANRGLAAGDPAEDVATQLTGFIGKFDTAVLRQKLGDLLVLQNRLEDASREYIAALKLDPSPQQRIHLQWGAARLLAASQKPAEALAFYDQFFTDQPGYPDLADLYREALPVARQANHPEAIERYERELARLSPAPSASLDAAPAYGDR